MSPRRAKLVFVAVTCLIAGHAFAGDPSLRWRTLETEHFRIHFYQGEEKLARSLAVRAERAHRILSPLLGHAPSRPTHIVLTDDVDSANGSASVLPYNLVRLYASGPESESVLNDFDDWMNLLERALLPLKRSLVRAPNDALAASPVAPLVNSVKNDGPELMRAAVE